jgi:hypothetical protein
MDIVYAEPLLLVDGVLASSEPPSINGVT